MPNLLQIYAPDPDLPPASQPLKTGQAVQYDGREDDGFWQKGISRLYQTLTVGQYAGTTNITVNGKTIAMENHAVKDMRTGKMWMRRTPDSDLGPGNDGKLLYIDAVNAEDIFEFCDQAKASNLSGHNDWYVPNTVECLQILDLGVRNPCIDVIVFPSTPVDYFWTGNTKLNPTTDAFRYHMDNADVNHAAKTTAHYIRLVRDF